MPVKRRRKAIDAGAEDGELASAAKKPAERPQEAEEEEAAIHPAVKKHKWKSVEMDVGMLTEFEEAGGMFLQECDVTDPSELGIMSADGMKLTADAAGKAAAGARRRKPKPKRKQEAAGALKAENERLRRELEGLKEKQVAAEVQAVDLPNWAPYDLHPSLLAALARLGFSSPTDVQARCLGPAIRQRKDLIGAAETGSGKTLAFGLPIFHHALTDLGTEPESLRTAGLRALAILPTRELAVQVQSHLNAAAQCTALRAECVVGGLSVQKQLRLLRRAPAVLVGTPGRLFALLGLGREAPKEERSEWLRQSLVKLRHLVLDEADRLVESGHFKELDQILSFVYESVGRQQQLQTFVFSATLTLDPRSTKHRAREDSDEGGKLGALIRRLQFREARAVHMVDLTRPEGEVAAPKESEGAKVVGSEGVRLPEHLKFREAVGKDDKDKEVLLAMWLLRRYRWSLNANAVKPGSIPGVPQRDPSSKQEEVATGGRVIVFMNAITTVLRLSSVLALLLESPSAEHVLARVRMSQDKDKNKKGAPALSVDVLGLHSKMRQKDRLKRMERFKKLSHAVLVCTDIAARGLDVPDIAAVLHYQAPRSAEVFVHRSGRTARAGRAGESVSFMVPGDAAQWGRVYRAVGITKPMLKDIDAIAPELAAAREASSLAAQLESKVHRIKKVSTDKTWMQRMAREAELVLDEDAQDPDEGKAAAPRRQLWGLYQQLQARVRREPRRLGGGPMPRRRKR